MARRGDDETARSLAEEAVVAAGQGADALLQATTCLEAARVLAALRSRFDGPDRASADSSAARAARTAVALVHQRGYRFLLRTKEATFEALRSHFGRWDVGSSLVPATPGGSLRIEMLGRFRVLVDGRAVPADAWKRSRARDIFALLVSSGGRPVSRARLADLYWPEADADSAHGSLRVTITAIRKAIGDVVSYEHGGYRFASVVPVSVDVEEFDRSVEAGRTAVSRGDAGEACVAYAAAVALYSGDFLDEMEEGGWQWRDRERLRAACLESLRWLVAHAGGGEGRLALERLLEIAPFDLDAVRMRLASLLGERRVAEARRDFDAWCARYRSTVGAEPPVMLVAGPNGLPEVR
jgi:DNA-binding SARP family transcriptional activator